MEELRKQFKDFIIPVAPSQLYDMQYTIYLTAKPIKIKKPSITSIPLSSLSTKHSPSPVIKK